MQTRGVASVRSPVCNLRQHKPDISHEGFVAAVVREFQDRYDIREAVISDPVRDRSLITDLSSLRSTGWTRTTIARVSRRSEKECTN